MFNRPATEARRFRLAFPLLALASALASPAAFAANPEDGQVSSPEAKIIQSIVDQVIPQYHLKGIIVQVRRNGKDLYLKAAGESMPGVLVTTNMHFRNGSMVFTYISTMLLELIDQHPQTLSLNDKLSKFFPEIPGSSDVTLKNLLNMTSGYQDYVGIPEVFNGINADPLRQWTPEELIEIGVTPERWFNPGENWAYSHTNYLILGRVLEKITGMPLDRAMQKYIFEPMGLRETKSIDTAQIPGPVMHSFTSERRGALQIPADIPFYEESTFWNPSWTTAKGAIQITDINDMSRSMEIVGNGALLSPTSYLEQVSPNLVGFGHPQDGCPHCTENTYARNYGLGVINLGPWITQTKNFAGNGSTVGYLPAARLTIAVVITYTAGAFDEQGNSTEASQPIFVSLANALAPNIFSPH
ncbi:class A beta-lactamase-related serine hydrolase [Dyella sp. M7H15-1]|uniref:serine hydrolase domain-containing protein n=1 Tax=Dyella sp. M7H15-1 TaxID=2501295 RepID=UPI001004DCDB|nr:serine hydrolase domain-containing protein [Dyella sp. M7H15-1]QAU23128.1 class A beta-lactamase-related serine hydrolase [Dyella sp. M7H15-1]